MKEDSRKKIIYLITKSFWGGATRYVFDLATSLPKDKFEVIVASGGEGILNDKLKENNVKTISIKELSRDINFTGEIRVFIELLGLFRKEKPSVVHLNSSKAGGLGAFTARVARVPKIIFTAHGWAFNEDRPLWQRVLIKIFVWITLLLSDEIICVSEQTRNDIRNFPLVYKKTKVIYNGIPEFSILEKSEARTILNSIYSVSIPHDAMWIGALSELHKNKGLEYAVKAISLLKNFPVVFVIMGAGELRKTLEETIKKEDLENKVFLLGFVEDARRYLGAFDIFVLPSVTEAFPYSVIEAGLAGLPVIASSVGGVVEIISSENGVLVKPKDYKSMGVELENLIRDNVRRERLGNKLKQKIEERFSFNNMISQTIELYL